MAISGTTLQPAPLPRPPIFGDEWVDPVTGERYIFNTVWELTPGSGNTTLQGAYNNDATSTAGDIVLDATRGPIEFFNTGGSPLGPSAQLFRVINDGGSGVMEVANDGDVVVRQRLTVGNLHDNGNDTIIAFEETTINPNTVDNTSISTSFGNHTFALPGDLTLGDGTYQVVAKTLLYGSSGLTSGDIITHVGEGLVLISGGTSTTLTNTVLSTQERHPTRGTNGSRLYLLNGVSGLQLNVDFPDSGSSYSPGDRYDSKISIEYISSGGIP